MKGEKLANIKCDGDVGFDADIIFLISSFEWSKVYLEYESLLFYILLGWVELFVIELCAFSFHFFSFFPSVVVPPFILNAFCCHPFLVFMKGAKME